MKKNPWRQHHLAGFYMLAAAPGLMASVCHADDDTQSAPLPAARSATAAPPPLVPLIPRPEWSPRPRRPDAIAPNVTPAAPPADDGDAPLFSSDGKWELAGYNNDEVIYTIFIESHDTRILRCIIQLSGFYYENGEKRSVTDRQSDTVFPQQKVQAGNWQGMDKQSGATYSVKCHPTS